MEAQHCYSQAAMCLLLLPAVLRSAGCGGRGRAWGPGSLSLCPLRPPQPGSLSLCCLLPEGGLLGCEWQPPFVRSVCPPPPRPANWRQPADGL